MHSLAGLCHLESYCSSICNKVLKSFFFNLIQPHSFVTLQEMLLFLFVCFFFLTHPLFCRELNEKLDTHLILKLTAHIMETNVSKLLSLDWIKLTSELTQFFQTPQLRLRFWVLCPFPMIVLSEAGGSVSHHIALPLDFFFSCVFNLSLFIKLPQRVMSRTRV